ncbi:MAG: hypothetical protein U0414_01820 [Polyangiaceae bacterium]
MTPRASAVIKAILRIAFVAVVVATGLTARVLIAGELEIAESTRALANGDARGATEHARAAALWFAPGAPHVRVAYARLVALAKAAEEHHDVEAALRAWRAVMAASSSTRWIVAPHAEDASRAAEAIARIESTQPRPNASALDAAPTVEKAELEALTREAGPRTAWLLVLGASFLALAGGLAWMILRAFDASGRLSLDRSKWAAIVAVAGAAGWTAALWYA